MTCLLSFHSYPVHFDCELPDGRGHNSGREELWTWGDDVIYQLLSCLLRRGASQTELSCG